jgi:hypothetical protein
MTSVQVTGRFLPARTWNGTPSHRGEWMSRRSAANVSVVEPGATPASDVKPRNCPRITELASRGAIAFSTFTFSSRIDSLSRRAGGSIARLEMSWKR